VDPHTKNVLWACSKTCHKKIAKALAGDCSLMRRWEEDGPGGPSDTVNSMSILLDWLLTEGNHSKWRGHQNNGTRKNGFGQQLSNLFKSKGIKVDRTAQAVVKKIQSIEGQFSAAHDWVNKTGQGVKEKDGDSHFEDCVRKRCKFHFELEPVMGDRAKARPKFTTEDLDDIDALLNDDDMSSVSQSSVSSAKEKVQQEDAPSDSQTPAKRINFDSSNSTGRKKKNQKMSRQSSLGDITDPIASAVEQRNSCLIAKQTQEAEIHLLEKEEKNMEVMMKMLENKERLEKMGHSKEKILRLLPNMKKVHEVTN
jgi:hypothetical protein